MFQPSGPRCIALHDYNSGEAGDLVFSANDVITLLDRVDADWLRGECQGQQGIFPTSFVSIVQDLPPKETGSFILYHNCFTTQSGHCLRLSYYLPFCSKY